MKALLSVRRDVDDGPWRRDAACRGRDRSTWFYPPVNHETRDERAAREQTAKEICHACAVRTVCLEQALTTREPFGIWGGLTEQERRTLLERQS